MKRQTTAFVLIGLFVGAVAFTAYRMASNKGEHSEKTQSPMNQQVAENKSIESSSLDVDSIPEIPNRPEGKRAKVNGIEMYYEVFGEGEPLLLIHGGAATIESWYEQIPAFSKKFKVIAVDGRGHGRTPDGEGPINFKVMAADYAALLKHLGIEKVSIVGWSDGGVTGLEMAMSNPDLVKKVVTLGAHSRPEGMTEEFKAGVEGSSPDNFPPILVGGYKALSPDGPDHWPVVFEKLKTMWLTLPNYQDSDLRGIRSPVLLVVGENDIVREEESKRMASLIPNARLKVLKGASHYSPVEIPETVNELILGFLAEP
jgi:pimeloyl-ACP methyl ester carboxylesterase